MEYEECVFPEIEQKKRFNVDNSLQKEVSFCNEIKSIIHAFGDLKKPLDSSVKLMHSILQGQMALLIKNAEDVMKLRKGKKISHEDILFLMRKNKVLLKRLLHFLYVEDMRTRFRTGIKKLGGEFGLEKTKKVSQCLKYLAFIEKVTGNLTSVLKNKDIVDHVHLKRLKRRDLMTNSMTKEEYENFFEFTLRETFCYKYTNEKFKKWLQQCSGTIFDITPLALSIIHFLARETIAGVVDKALEIKSRKFEKSKYFPLRNFNNSVDLFDTSEEDSDLNESEDNSDLDELENTSDLDEPEKDFEMNEPEKDFEMNESANNYQPSLSENSGNSFDRNKNSDIKENINFPNGFQEMNLFSNVSHYTNNIVNCPVATNARRNMMFENTAIENATNDMQKENTASNSSHLDQNIFSRNYASGKSDSISNASNFKSKMSYPFPDSDKKLNDNARKSERNYDVCDSFESDNRFSGTIIDETSSTMNCESRSNQGSRDVLLRVLHAPKKISRKPCFSVNFQEKPFSVCCDGSKIVEIGTSSASAADRDNDTKDTEDKDLTTSCIEEFVEASDFDEFKTGFVSKSFFQDFGKYFRNFLFTARKKTDSKIHWFPKDAITPTEIQAAFIEYQRPLPMSVLLKTKLSYLPLRKINLVCLANPDTI